MQDTEMWHMLSWSGDVALANISNGLASSITKEKANKLKL